jgi:hypothetical protein
MTKTAIQTMRELGGDAAVTEFLSASRFDITRASTTLSKAVRMNDGEAYRQGLHLLKSVALQVNASHLLPTIEELRSRALPIPLHSDPAVDALIVQIGDHLQTQLS